MIPLILLAAGISAVLLAAHHLQPSLLRYRIRRRHRGNRLDLRRALKRR